MGQRWIIDVLTDLKTFAQINDLPLLAQQLDDCARVAVGEIAEMTGVEPLRAQGAEAGTRKLSGEGGKGHGAGRHSVSDH